MKVVTYTRVSSKEQLKEGFSIPAQRALLQQYAREHRLEIVAEFSDDETAKHSGRTDFVRMLSFLRATPSVRSILVEKTDRLYRNLKDYLTLDELDVTLHLVKEGSVISPDSHSSARFLHGIKVLMARNYSENLSEEVTKGMLEKARQGSWPSWAPLGYVNIKGPGGISPDPERASLIVRLFDAAASGRYSLRDLTGFATLIGLRSRKGQRLAKSLIAALLRNPLYAGTFRWKGTTYRGVYEAIITTDLYDRVQVVLAGRSRTTAYKHAFTYTGLVRCGTCNGLLTGDRKKERYVYYACKGTKHCKRYYPESFFDQHSLALLDQLTIPREISEWITAELLSWYDEACEQDNADALRLRRRIAELEGLQRGAYEDKLRGAIPEAAWRSHHERWQGDIDECTKVVRSGRPSGDREGFRKRLAAPFELLQLAKNQFVTREPMEKARLLQTLCSNFTVNAGSLEPSMLSPFDVLLTGAQTGNWSARRDSNPGPTA